MANPEMEPWPIRCLDRAGSNPPKLELLDLSFLEKERQRQIDRFIELGFHKELGMTERKYKDSFPQITPQPERFRGRFDIPILVEPRISPEIQCQKLGIIHFLSDLPIKDWSGDIKGYKTPQIPYVTWMQDGTKNLGLSVAFVRKTLAEDARGATIYDGLALFAAHPNILKSRYIDLPGTQVGSAYAPFLHSWSGRPELRYGLVGYAHSNYGSASCGR